MQQLIKKPRRRSQAPGARKNPKIFENLKKKCFLKKIAQIRDIKILKSFPVHLEVMQ